MSKIVLDLNYPQFNQMPRFELGTSSELMIQVTDNGQIVDLTDHVVTLVVLSPDLQVVSQVLSIDDAISGLVRCEMDDQLLASVGRFSARLLLVDADSNKASTGYFGYIVVDEELNADDIPMDEHTMYLLTEIVAKLTELELLEASREIAESDRISNEATRIEDEELRQDNENARMRAESAREQRVQAVLTQANEIVKVLNTNVDSALVDLYHRAEEWFLVNDAEIAEFYRSISLQIDALLNDANERFREQLDNVTRILSNMINQYIAQAEAELDQYQVTTTRDLSNRLNSYIAEVDKEIDGYKDNLQQQFNEALAETNEMATEYLEKLSTDVHTEMDTFKDDLMNQVDKYTDNAEQIITNTKTQMESAVNAHIEITDERVDAKLEDIQGQITEAIDGVQTQVTDYLAENQEIIDKMVNDGYNDVSEFLGQAYSDIENWEQETKAELDTSVEEYKDAVDEFKEYNEQAHIDEDKRKQDHAQREAQLKTYEGRLENLEANHGGDVYERLRALEEVNRMQEIHLRALTNQDTSGKLEHTIQGNNELLPYSGNGVAQFMSIEGNTAVNVVDDHGEIFDATPAIEGNAGRVVEDITPVDTKINPVIEGHTLVNTVECETPRIVPYEIDEVTTSHLPLTKDGHIIPKAVGRTLVNHNAEHDASIKLNSTVINASGDVIEGLASDGSADVSVKLTGTTMVNLADPAQEVPMTKAYDSVANTHHTELPVETDWYVRPVVHGHTLVNRAYGEREVLTMPEFNVEMEGNTATVTEGMDGGKIEVNNVTGRTLVNVCDQKDPVAITKSYTVENSGNHVALQGEYDGSCRPVVQGNTMVNLHPSRTPQFARSDEDTTDYVIDASDNYIKVTYDTSGTGATYRYINAGTLNIDLLKPNTTYTVVFTKLTGIRQVAFVRGDSQNGLHVAPGIVTKDKLYTTVTTIDTITPGSQILYLLVEVGDTMLVEVENPMIFEGDLTQTPELIPTEYVEGLKSTFEDNKIPESLVPEGSTSTVTCATTGSAIAGNMISLSKTIPKGSVVTVVCKVTNINVANRGALRIGAYTPLGNWTGGSYPVNSEGYFCSVTMAAVNDEVTQVAIVSSGDSTAGDTCTIEDVKVFEGDWTHLSPEDFNHLGKYKVEYKVTGKNKFNGHTTTGYFDEDSGHVYEYDGYKWCFTDFIDVRHVDTLAFSASDLSQHNVTYLKYDENRRYLGYYGFYNSLTGVIDTSTSSYIRVRLSVLHTDIQLEEGTTATEYEPYKEYTKTFYLNSPLLEGDTIEDVNGVATHVKRYNKVVLDGSEDWKDYTDDPTYHTKSVTVRQVTLDKAGPASSSICDRFIWGESGPGNKEDYEHHRFANGTGGYSTRFYIWLSKSKASTLDEFKQWLSENPTTVVHQLATPIYEPISPESILCDSYVNGHLDFVSAVPVEKVNFLRSEMRLRYLTPNTVYTVQFKSDNTGMCDYMYFGGTDNQVLSNLNIIKGVNSFQLATGSNLYLGYPHIAISGIGFNASNIQVVAVEDENTEFGYFEGIKSSYECERVENVFNGVWEPGTIVGITDDPTRLGDEYDGFDVIDTRCRTEFMLIDSETMYLIRGIGILRVHFYDANHKWISMEPEYVTSFTAPQGTTYVRFVVDTTKYDLSDIILLENVSDEDFNHLGQYKVDYKVVGKNLLNPLWVNGTYYTDSGYLNQGTGNIADANFTRVKANTSYALTLGAVDGRYCNARVFFYRDIQSFDDITFIKDTLVECSRGGQATFTTPPGTKYIRFHLAESYSRLDLVQIQLEEGATRTLYEPYKESTKTIYLNSPLLEGDELRVQDGWIGHYHKMGKVVLDGSEAWTHSIKDYSVLYAGYLGINKANFSAPNHRVFCDNLKPTSLFGGTTDTGIYVAGKVDDGNSEAQIRVRLKESGNSKEGTKEFLRSNPTTVVYELANPYFEPLVKANALSLDVFNTNSTVSTNSIVPISQASITNLGYELIGYSNPYTLDYKVKDGTKDDVVVNIKDDRLYFHSDNEAKVSDVVLVDGTDTVLTGEYFEGMMSTYECKKLPENLSPEGIVILDTTEPHAFGIGTPQLLSTLVPGKTYSMLFVCTGDVTGISSTLRDSNTGEWKQDIISTTQTFSKGINCVVFTPQVATERFLFYQSVVMSTKYSVLDFTVVEGDWSHLTEDDVANIGKYKVDITTHDTNILFGKGGRL